MTQQSFLRAMKTLKEALNVLEVYGSYSGLKMNKEKSELVWVGKTKDPRPKCVKI